MSHIFLPVSFQPILNKEYADILQVGGQWHRRAENTISLCGRESSTSQPDLYMNNRTPRGVDWYEGLNFSSPFTIVHVNKNDKFYLFDCFPMLRLSEVDPKIYKKSFHCVNNNIVADPDPGWIKMQIRLYIKHVPYIISRRRYCDLGFRLKIYWLLKVKTITQNWGSKRYSFKRLKKCVNF